MKQKLAILVGFLFFGAVLLLVVTRKQPQPTATPTSTTTEITLEYSTEKKDWLEAAVATFHAAHPEITVTLVGKGSLEAEQAIANGEDKPTLWSPADSSIANLLVADWKGGKPYAAAPEPLLLTPLVYAVWEDRAQVLLAASGGTISWTSIHAAVSSPKGWPGIGGKPGWGFVKLGHTDPTRSNSGVEALTLMAYEFFGSTTPLTVEQLLDPKFQAFVQEIEAGVPHFEASTGTFMTDMIRFGPSKYDIAVVYEALAVSQLANAQGRWGSLHIYYPPVTIWSDHPIARLDGDWVTPPQRAAADQLIAYLRSVPAQSTALSFGFRPADPSVPMKTEGSPFAKLDQFGVSLELPPAAQPPSGEVVHNLMQMWSRLVKAK
ncbi:MAG TPA: substrate-binding domain-containing protein [Kofleriaceae bacterium]|jgi:hypothetical protein